MRLLWMDLEMTGLDATRERILEVAAIITDMELQPLSDYHSVVYQGSELLSAMDEWNRTTHTASGLLNLVPQGKSQNQVDQELAEWVSGYFNKERAVLAGNSIHQDRKFIDLYLPKLASALHYRMLDVSAFKILFRERFKLSFEKGNSHRALEDVQASIDELRYYIGFISPGGSSR
jgi:oligoribonuclease